VREVNCPGCGAPVTFLSAASLLAVCPFCRATLMRRDLDVERVGTMAALVADPSPIQLQAEGVYRHIHFAVVGRIQVRYDVGAWNEWYLVFDDGRAGWLGDAGGEYAITFERPVSEPVPPWSALSPGTPVTLAGETWEVTDLEEAEIIGGEGELPFAVEAAGKTAAADLRGDGVRFATIDYGDETPRVFVGETVELRALAMRGLRETDGWR
jgi:hypothetical protein